MKNVPVEFLSTFVFALFSFVLVPELLFVVPPFWLFSVVVVVSSNANGFDFPSTVVPDCL